MAYTIDTAAAISDLEAAGVETKVARAIVRTFAAANDELATKSDLTALKVEFAALKAEFVALKADLKALKAELTMRIIAAQVATAMLLFAALRFFGA